MQLSEYEKLWEKALVSGENTAASLGIAFKRLELYQGFIKNHYLGALKKMFPRLRAYKKDIDWELWSQQFYEAFPPKAWELNNLTLSFPQFIQEKCHKGELPLFIHDLVRYELAEFFVYKSPCEKDKAQDNFLKINPAHELLILDFDIPSWIFECEKKGNALQGEPLNEQTLLVIARDFNSFNCVFTKLSLTSAYLYQLLSQNCLTEEQLCSHMMTTLSSQSPLTVDSIKSEIEALKRQSIVYL